MPKKISQLPESFTLAGTDLFEKAIAGVSSNKFSGASLRAALLSPSVIGGTAGTVPVFAAATPFLANSPMIVAAGFVGIGTLAPATAFHVATSITTSPRGIMSSQHNDGTDGAQLGLRKSRGTNAVPTTVVSGDRLGKISVTGYDGASYIEMASILIGTEGTIGANRIPTNLSFWTATDASPSVSTQNLTILSNGSVGIGTSTPSERLAVSGNAQIGGVLVDAATTPDRPIYFAPQKYIDAGTMPPKATLNQTVITYPTLTDTTVPFSTAALFASYSEGYVSDYIPVTAGETIYGEIWAMRQTGSTGTAGVLYYGVSQYDKDKKYIASNGGLQYLVSGVVVPQNSAWNKYSGSYTLPTSHTPFSGSDGGPVRYVRVYLVVDYSTGTIPTYVSGMLLRRVNVFRDSGTVAFTGGNVGIGTTSPSGILHLYSSEPRLFIQDNSGTEDNWYISSVAANQRLRIVNNDSGIGEALTILRTGNVGIGTTSPGSRLHALLSDAVTNVVSVVSTIEHSSSGTPAANFGAGILFNLQSSTTAGRNAGQLSSIWTTATDASRTSALLLSTVNNAGALTEGLRVGGEGDMTAAGFLLWAGHKRVSTQFDKTSDTALANVTGLSVSLLASRVYTFEAILYTSSNVAGGVQFSISGTATATAIIYEATVESGGSIVAETRATSLGTSVGGITAVTAAYCRITGTITVNAAGTLTVQFAQNASNGSASSVLVGSTFKVHELV